MGTDLSLLSLINDKLIEKREIANGNLIPIRPLST